MIISFSVIFRTSFSSVHLPLPDFQSPSSCLCPAVRFSGENFAQILRFLSHLAAFHRCPSCAPDIRLSAEAVTRTLASSFDIFNGGRINSNFAPKNRIRTQHTNSKVHCLSTNSEKPTVHTRLLANKRFPSLKRRVGGK